VSTPSTLFHSVVRLAACYVLGIVAGNIILLPWTGPLAIAFIIGGAVIALPLLMVALFVLLLFCNHIQEHLLVWCLFAPISVVIGWLAMEYLTIYFERVDLLQYLAIRNVLERAFLAFVCTSLASLVFYYWNVRYPLSRAARAR
jgi:hypothetical protein